MRTSTLLAIFLILNICFNANAVFLKKPSKATYSVFNQLKSIENTGFGEKLLDTIALQVKNQSPLQDIAKLLAEIRTDLATTLATKTQQIQERRNRCESELARLDSLIAENNQKKSDAEAEIKNLTGEISQLKGEIANKGVQLEILDRREKALEEARSGDAEDFKRRQENAVQVMQALDLIIEKLQTIDANTNDESLVLAELNKIGGSNPIMALVQVAATFSQESLDNVVAKLGSLKQSIEASIEEDKNNESQSEAEFKALEQEIKKTRKDVQQAKAEAENRLAQAEQALEMQQKTLEEATKEILRLTEARATEDQACKDAEVKYAEEKSQIESEIQIVKEVEEIIATKLDTMKDYLKGRVDV